MNENAPLRRIEKGIEELIRSFHLVPNEELKQKMIGIAMKSENEEGNMPTNTLEQGVQSVIAKVKDMHDDRSVKQCKKLMERFADNHFITNKPEILTMLTMLSQLNIEVEEYFPEMLRPIRYGNFSIERQMRINGLPSNQAISSAEDQRVIRSRRDIVHGATEQQIVRELLYVFTNSKSNDIIEENEDEYHLRGSVEASGTVRKIVSHIADLGWLHKKIISTKLREGLIVKSLNQAMHAELQQFYIWNSNLELLKRDNRLSLRKLYVKTFLPQLMLTWLAIILEAVEPYNGCEIISIVNSYRPNGSDAVNSLINRILCIIIQPLLRYIYNWMYMGVLHDPHKEFFITENEHVPECEEWQKRFTLIREMIPNLLNQEAAIMILNTGKSISFLKNKCKVYYDIKVPYIEEQQVKEYISRGFSSFNRDFMRQLREVYNEVNHVLLRTLFEDFHLRYHFQSMKHFYLMGKGDFCQYLYDGLKAHLLVEEEIPLHRLDAIVSETAIKCFKDFKLPYGEEFFRKSVLDRLLAKMVKYEGGNNAWDLINFQYSLQRIELLRNLFPPSIMGSYERIFSFLWKVKQITVILQDLWLIQSKQALKIRKFKNGELNEMHQKAYLLRNTMNHFMTNLHGYLMVAIESSWNKFDEAISSIANFDDILNIHKHFQKEILEITFSTASEQATRSLIIDIFAVINTFRIIYQRLQENIDEYHDAKMAKEERTSLSKRSILAESRDTSSYHFENSHKQIVTIQASFNRIFKKIYIQLSRNRGSDRSSLLARLNFSQFYQKDQLTGSLDDQLE